MIFNKRTLKTMKKRFLIKSFLISFLLVCFSFSGYAQKVSLDYSKVTLKTVLKTITEQTGYNFIYSNELSQINQPISITYKSENESVIPLFDILFKQNGISYQIKQKQVILSPADLKAKTSNPQNQQKPKSEFSVNGKITDNEKIPLPGVSVYNTRTKKGTITDINVVTGLCQLIECNTLNVMETPITIAIASVINGQYGITNAEQLML